MNAKNELQDILKNKAPVKCASINHGKEWDVSQHATVILPVKHTKKQEVNFFKQLDFEYDNGYGGQELFGYVWLKDGTWLERGEYDGSKWWEYKRTPDIPKELL
jgi:hypothetical protein